MVLSIARHWVNVDASVEAELKVFPGRIAPVSIGMTQRDRERLRALEDPSTLHRLVTLPDLIRARVLRLGQPSRSLALRLQTALAIELLLMAPIRIGTHLPQDRRGQVTLCLAEHEVKNGLPIELRLPRPPAELRDLEHIAAFNKLCRFHRVDIHTVSEGEISELHIGLKGSMGALYLKDLA